MENRLIFDFHRVLSTIADQNASAHNWIDPKQSEQRKVWFGDELVNMIAKHAQLSALMKCKLDSSLWIVVYGS